MILQGFSMKGYRQVAGKPEDGLRRCGSRWRMAPWIAAAFLLLLPFVAMQFTNQVSWDETDFLVMGAMLFGACGAWELAARMTGNSAYRAAVGVAVVAAFLLIWINLAVGIIGSEDNPANLMYLGVLAIGLMEPSSPASDRREWCARSSHGIRADAGRRDRPDRRIGQHGRELAARYRSANWVLRYPVAHIGLAILESDAGANFRGSLQKGASQGSRIRWGRSAWDRGTRMIPAPGLPNLEAAVQRTVASKSHRALIYTRHHRNPLGPR